MNSAVMDKANLALRRSSIRLRSLNSGHGDLNMIISDLKDVRATCKKYTNAQKLAWDDMSKWAAREKNVAMQEAFHYLSELGDLWCEIQREFIGGIKRLQQYYEFILESETHLDKSRAYLTSCEKTEFKIRKDFDKLNSRSSSDHNVIEERKVLNERLVHAAASISAAQLEVTNKSMENESMKIVKVKEGMSDFSENFLDLAFKTSMIFTAHVKVVDCLPDARTLQIEDLKYSGSEISRKAVAKAKDDIHCYKRQSERANAPPPPYSSNPSSPASSHGQYSNFSSPVSSHYTEADGRYCEIPEYHEPSAATLNETEEFLDRRYLRSLAVGVQFKLLKLQLLEHETFGKLLRATVKPIHQADSTHFSTLLPRRYLDILLDSHGRPQLTEWDNLYFKIVKHTPKTSILEWSYTEF